MNISPSIVMRAFKDLGMAFEAADPVEQPLIQTAKRGDLGPLMDHLSQTDPEALRTRTLVLQSAILLALVDAGVHIDDLSKDAKTALAKFDLAKTRPDIGDHLTPSLRRMHRTRLVRMVKRAEQFDVP